MSGIEIAIGLCKANCWSLAKTLLAPVVKGITKQMLIGTWSMKDLLDL